MTSGGVFARMISGSSQSLGLLGRGRATLSRQYSVSLSELPQRQKPFRERDGTMMIRRSRQ